MNNNIKKGFPLIVQQARKEYVNRNYSQAWRLYKRLSRKIGPQFFKANLYACQSREPVRIILICDRDYALPTYIAAFSIINNFDKVNKLFLHIVICDTPEWIITLFKRLQSHNISIEIIKLNNRFSTFKIHTDGFHVSSTAIIKFEIPNILKSIDRVLYLDGDIIVKKDISEVFYTDIRNKYAGVVKDMKPILKYRPNILIRLDIQSHRSYFNSGVLLLNLAKLREDDMINRLFWYRIHGINNFMDQDAFNVTFQDNVEYMSLYFNTLVSLPDEFDTAEISKYYNLHEDFSSFDEIIDKSYITHFTSKKKPWNSKCTNFKLWDKYFEDSKLIENVKASLQNTILENVIISLTTYPPRIDSVHNTLKSLLNQSIKAEKIILWLAEEDFPKGEEDLPESLKEMREHGIIIGWYKSNLHSSLKLIPTLKKYSESIIVTADDDILYQEDWLLHLYISYIFNPSAIHCHRIHQVRIDRDKKVLPYNLWGWTVRTRIPSYCNFLTGVGGVLYPPHSLDEDVFREDLYMKLCPTGDDIWFWAMALLHGTKIQQVWFSTSSLDFVDGTQDTAMWKDNVKGENHNDEMIKNIFAYYPKLLDIIRFERWL